MACESLFIQKGVKMKTILLTLLFIVTYTAGKNINEKKYQGKAFDIKSKNSLYIEHHTELYNRDIQQKTTHYLSLTGDTIARREMTFNDDLTKPDFILEDLRSGYLESAELIGDNKVKVSTRESRNSKLENKVLTIPGDFVIDAGLTYFFRKNWDRLLKSEKIDFYFITPSKLDYFKFRVYSIGMTNYAGINALKIRLEVSSWILRQFVDPVDIIYSMDDKEILYYEGISNINDNKGKSLQVIIDYKNNMKVN